MYVNLDLYHEALLLFAADGCNGSTSVTVSFVGLVVALIAGFMFITTQWRQDDEEEK